MSQQVSPSTDKVYGLERVARLWGVPRATVYRHRHRAEAEIARRRPGPLGAMPDEGLVQAIRQLLEDSPFHGEGYRKLWARLRFAGIRTSRRRVLLAADQQGIDGMTSLPPVEIEVPSPAAARAPGARLPRFRRMPVGEHRLRPIDYDILRAIGRFRLLQSRHLEKLVTGIGTDRLRRHLHALYHHGYVDRPDGQIVSMLSGGGSCAMVYTLAAKGVQLLHRHDGVRHPLPAPDVGHGYLTHELEVQDVVVALAVACRAVPALDLLLLDELRDEALPQSSSPWAPHKWSVPVTFGGASRSLFVEPDAIVALHHREAAPERARKGFFIEADRGTMSIVKRDITQSSIVRKLLCYRASYHEGIHRERFGMHSVRVLIVTTSPGRARQMVEVCKAHQVEYDLPSRLFLFTDRAALFASPNIFSASWIDEAGAMRTIVT